MYIHFCIGGRRGPGRMVVEFTTTCWIPLSWGVLDSTLCDKFCQWLSIGRWFSPYTTVSSTSKADRHNITEILLKVAWNTIALFNSLLYQMIQLKMIKLYDLVSSMYFFSNITYFRLSKCWPLKNMVKTWPQYRIYWRNISYLRQT